MLGEDYDTVDSWPYEKVNRWYQYFERRPYGWREDHRAALVALSFGGSEKTKPEDLFPSLRVIKEGASQSGEDKTFAGKFLDRFSKNISGGKRYDRNTDSVQ